MDKGDATCMSEEKKKSMLEKIADFLEIKEVETGKPPAKTQETPVHADLESEKPSEVQPPEEGSAIEVEMPAVGEVAKIGEEGKRRRIKLE